MARTVLTLLVFLSGGLVLAAPMPQRRAVAPGVVDEMEKRGAEYGGFFRNPIPYESPPMHFRPGLEAASLGIPGFRISSTPNSRMLEPLTTIDQPFGLTFAVARGKLSEVTASAIGDLTRLQILDLGALELSTDAIRQIARSPEIRSFASTFPLETRWAPQLSNWKRLNAIQFTCLSGAELILGELSKSDLQHVGLRCETLETPIAESLEPLKIESFALQCQTTRDAALKTLANHPTLTSLALDTRDLNDSHCQ